MPVPPIRPARSADHDHDHDHEEIAVNRISRVALTGGLALAAALTVGGAALAGPDAPPAPAAVAVAVQDPSPDRPGSAGDRDCPDGAGGAGGASGPSEGAPTPSAAQL